MPDIRPRPQSPQTAVAPEASRSWWRLLSLPLKIRLIGAIVVFGGICASYGIHQITHGSPTTTTASNAIPDTASVQSMPPPAPNLRWTTYTAPPSDGTSTGFSYELAATNLDVSSADCPTPVPNSQPCATVTVEVKSATPNASSYQLYASSFKIAVPEALLNAQDAPDPEANIAPLPGDYRLTTTTSDQSPSEMVLAANEVETFKLTTAYPLAASTTKNDIELYFTPSSANVVIPITK